MTTIIPLKKAVTANVQMPGSKSYTNRALIMAALTKGPVVLKNPLYSDDTEAMIDCLRTLGLKLNSEPDRIIVYNDVSVVQNKSYQLFARDSGTTVRFILALLCIVPGIKTLQGSPRLNKRPISDLIDALRTLGAQIEYVNGEGQLPIKVTSSTLSKRSAELKGDLSSQFCSAMLLIAPLLQGFKLHMQGPCISQPYVDMTVNCMQEWGVDVVQADKIYSIPDQAYQKKEYLIEGDFSSAGYFFALAALTQSTITLENLNPTSKQADRQFLAILEKMGNRVTYGENGITVQGKGVMALDVNMEGCPDQVMTLAVLAAFAKGVTRISGVCSLRYKETERVVALKNELKKMGIHTEDSHDTLHIWGGVPRAAEIDTYNDHRMAMAFAVAGMHLKGMSIRNPEVVNKTFPSFWEVLGSLR